MESLLFLDEFYDFAFWQIVIDFFQIMFQQFIILLIMLSSGLANKSCH